MRHSDSLQKRHVRLTATAIVSRQDVFLAASPLLHHCHGKSFADGATEGIRGISEIENL